MSKPSIFPDRLGWIKCFLSGVLLSALLTSPAAAHLMVAQRGTLNFVDDGAYMVLSLPVSAFPGIDDDGDGKMSTAEFQKHRLVIVEAVREKVHLLDEEGARPLHGMMLSPVVPHVPGMKKAPSEQLIILGRFELADTIDKEDKLTFYSGLFGEEEAEQKLEITASRPIEPKKNKIVLTPKKPEGQLFLSQSE